MLLNRIEFKLTLKTDSEFALHSGETIKDVEENNGQDEERGDIRCFVENDEGKLIIPASSMKGAMRSFFMNDPEFADHYFGNANQNDEAVGQMGLLHLYDAVSDQTFANVVQRQKTAINRQTGTAYNNKLFKSGTLGKNSEFELKGRLFIPNQANLEDAKDALIKLLSVFRQGAGFRVGAGGRMLQGQISIHSGPFIAARLFDASKGEFPDYEEPDEILKLGEVQNKREDFATITLNIASDTPFIIIGERQRANNSAADSPQISPLKEEDRDGQKRPVLPATSLIGALRSRLALLAERAILRGEMSLNPDSRRADDRFLDAPSVNNNKNKIDGAVRKIPADLKKLEPLERLFGVSGFAGLLEVAHITSVSPGETQNIQQIAIDRFTGGVLYGATFRTETFIGCQWAITLRIDKNRADAIDNVLGAGQCENDLNILAKLFSDHTESEEHFYLGHGASKGWGWFDLSAVVEMPEAKQKGASHAA